MRTKIYNLRNKKYQKKTREELTLTTQNSRGCAKKAYTMGMLDLKRVEKHFLLTKEVMEYFKKT